MNTILAPVAAAFVLLNTHGLVLAQTASTNAAPSTATKASTPVSAPLNVVVSIPPLKGLIEPMLPEGSKIELLVPPGVSEHGYEIPPGRLAQLAKADVVVWVGLGMEPQVEKALTNTARANASAGASSRVVIKLEDVPAVKASVKPESSDHEHHHHDPQTGACVHEIDPHAWLDPMMALALTDEIAQQLAKRELGANAGETQIRAWIDARPAIAKLQRQIMNTHLRLQQVTSNAERRTIVVAHDAFGWLARRYDLSVVPLAGLNAQEPRPDDLRKAAETVRELKLTTVFIEPQVSKASAERVAKLAGAKLDTLDPLGDGDWLKLMKANTEALERALGRKNAAGAPSTSPTQAPGEKPASAVR